MAKFNREDWTELFFEWHRAVGTLSLTFSFIERGSPELKSIAALKYTILTGLLNRCSRLMMANLCLAADHRHDEVIGIVNRSLHETAIKLTWLSQSKSRDRFQRFLADGLKGDLELRQHIRRNVAQRGHVIELEGRMLRSVARSLSTAGMGERKIKSTKRLPDLATMMRDIGMNDLHYTVVQRIGSHFVHGTWTGLLVGCLKPDENGTPVLKEGFNSPHPNQLMLASLLVLSAIRAFASFAVKPVLRSDIVRRLDAYLDELQRQNAVMAGPDLEHADGLSRPKRGLA